MIKTINDLYQEQKRIWNEENEKFFGLSTFDNWKNSEKVNEHLKLCTKKFWNNGTNELKKLLENGKCKDINKLIENGYELVFDSKNEIVCLFGSFEYEKDIVENGRSKKVKNIKRSPLVYIPYANDLCMFLNGTEYALRITASVNYSLISRTANICKYQKIWEYNVDNDEFTIKIDDEDYDPFINLTQMNKDFLDFCLRSKYNDDNINVNKNNFKDALKSIPEFDSHSILYFKFEHLSELFKMVSFSNRFANPLSRIPVPINIVKMFASQRIKDENRGDGSDSFSNLVLTTNKLFSLENSRTVIYKSKFNSSFGFTDCDQFFDAFKTSTNKSAGRSRLILDDVYIQNKFMYKKDSKTGKLYSMFDVLLNKKIENNNNLSVLSCSRFSSNNDPKRIMMTAKFRAQAIPTYGEIDQFTHETPARIVFGDFEGFNFGDSIIISRSFARKLMSRRTMTKKVTRKDIYNEMIEKYKVGDIMSPLDLNYYVGTFNCDNMRNIHIDSFNQDSITFTADAPFSVGDKITNFHGSKGIVSIILPDEKMPYLENDLGPNMPAGPMDIICSALSVYRRKALGQIFEAWALASGIDDVNNIQDAVDNYSENMKEYSDKSIISFNGTRTIKPCGINMFIRLNHDSISHESRSPLKTNYGKMLKFGEMELLNLAARDLTEIINELDIRSVNKHVDSFAMIRDMQKDGEIILNDANNLKFFNLLKTIGFDFNLRTPENNYIDKYEESVKRIQTKFKVGDVIYQDRQGKRGRKKKIVITEKDLINDNKSNFSMKDLITDDVVNIFDNTKQDNQSKLDSLIDSVFYSAEQDKQQKEEFLKKRKERK